MELSIFLVDDHPAYRAGLQALVERRSPWTICGEASTAAEALENVPLLKPDLVVADLSLPDMSGLDLIPQLRAVCPAVPVLILSAHDEELYAERVIRAGGNGYLTKGATSEKLVEAISRVFAGEVSVSPAIAASLIRSLTSKKPENRQSRLACLTSRERELFELIGRGIPSATIARQLQISPRTVDAHRSNIKSKLGIPDAVSLNRDAFIWVGFQDSALPGPTQDSALAG